jgi:hypothetical protein
MLGLSKIRTRITHVAIIKRTFNPLPIQPNTRPVVAMPPPPSAPPLAEICFRAMWPVTVATMLPMIKIGIVQMLSPITESMQEPKPPMTHAMSAETKLVIANELVRPGDAAYCGGFILSSP